MLEKNELLLISGGALKINGAFLNYISKSINSIIDLGRSLGSAIRRAIGGTLCPI